MGWWNDHVFPRLADAALASPYVAGLREQVCAGLSGTVLEIGFGSGRNVPHYPPAVTEVIAVEPNDVGWRMSEGRRGAGTIEITRAGLDAQRIPCDDASVDAVLTTFTLCSIPDVELALRECRRVLRPGGVMHFLEHGHAPDEGVQRWQRRLEPVQRKVAAGCHLTRDVPDLLTRAGFDVSVDHAAYLPGPSVSAPWGWITAGRARVVG